MFSQRAGIMRRSRMARSEHGFVLNGSQFDGGELGNTGL